MGTLRTFLNEDANASLFQSFDSSDLIHRNKSNLNAAFDTEEESRNQSDDAILNEQIQIIAWFMISSIFLKMMQKHICFRVLIHGSELNLNAVEESWN